MAGVNGRVNAIVALDTGVDRDAIENALPVANDIQVAGLVDGLDETWTVLQEAKADLLIIACAGYSDRALVLIDASVKQRPDRPVVVLAYGSPNGFVRRVFEAGADDIVTLPEDPEQILFALQKAVARKLGGTTITSSQAPMICVLGPKGGTGKTLTACNLAVSLAEGERRVALVDLDLQFGDVGLSLGLAPDRTVADLARAGGSIDGEKLDAYLATHAPSGVRVLLAPTRPDQAAVITVPFLRDLYAALRANFDYVVVDTPPGFTPEVIASIDNSSQICMVGMLDALSLKNTKLGLETLDLMGYDAARITVVLNRADSRVGIERDDVVAILGREPDVLVPSDRDISRAVNEGMPIVQARERSDAAKAFRGLAESFVRQHAPVGEQPSRRSLLRVGRKS